MNKTKVKPKIKPLTPRQADVLSQIEFGEVELKTEYWGVGHSRIKARDRLNVDCSSVVGVLRKYKMVRKVTHQEPPIKLPNGTIEHSLPFYYLTLTPDGYAELAKYPERWNV